MVPQPKTKIGDICQKVINDKCYSRRSSNSRKLNRQKPISEVFVGWAMVAGSARIIAIADFGRVYSFAANDVVEGAMKVMRIVLPWSAPETQALSKC